MLRGTGDSKTSSSQVVLGSSEVKINNDEFNIINIGRSSNSMSTTGHDDDDDDDDDDDEEEEDRVGAIDDNNEVQRSFAGNRWPRQETLALLKIRSDMDVAFRDATVKVPLWDQISRKLGELGYNRSAKKCKEKFENVYKYHKRTKEGRSGKPDGKTYRFFEQLKALENQPPPPPSSSHHHQLLPLISQSKSQQIQAPTMVVTSSINNVTTFSSFQQTNAINLIFPSIQTPTNPTINLPAIQPSSTTNTAATVNPTNLNQNMTKPSTFHPISTDLFSNWTSSSTSSDEEIEGTRRNRKRKWKDFFERLMTEVIQKQEELQNRFLEAIEKREHERMVREEEWRIQEMARINRDREILAQERSMAAAKDSAVMAFLQEISKKQNQPSQNIILQPPGAISPIPIPTSASEIATQQQLPLVLSQQILRPLQLSTINLESDNNGEHCNELMPASSSRWPKVEIEALIKLRTKLDSKYQENSPKGPLWEEISNSMKKLGYNRNPKRCKEKWENINKYYKKVKESNKKRHEDSKTCPYFHQLEALHKEKSKLENTQVDQFKPVAEINSMPIMVRPEQQWPPSQEENNNKDIAMEDHDPMNQNQDEDDDRDGDDDYDDDDDDDDDDDESDGNYELVANKPSNDNIAVSNATAV